MPFVQRQHLPVSALFKHLVSEFLVQLCMRDQRVQRHMIDTCRDDGLAIWRNLAVFNDGNIALHPSTRFSVQISHTAPAHIPSLFRYIFSVFGTILKQKTRFRKVLKRHLSSPVRLTAIGFLQKVNKINGFQNLLFLIFQLAGLCAAQNFPIARVIHRGAA